MRGSFDASACAPIFRVPDTGGNPKVVTQPSSGVLLSFPHALPDGRHFLYYSAQPSQPGGVYVGNLDGIAGRRLLDADAAASYVAPDHLLVMRNGRLWAQRFDPDTLTLDQGAAQLDMVPTRVWAGVRLVPVSASRTGTIVYRSNWPQPPMLTALSLGIDQVRRSQPSAPRRSPF